MSGTRITLDGAGVGDGHGGVGTRSGSEGARSLSAGFGTGAWLRPGEPSGPTTTTVAWTCRGGPVSLSAAGPMGPAMIVPAQSSPLNAGIQPSFPETQHPLPDPCLTMRSRFGLHVSGSTGDGFYRAIEMIIA